MIDRKKDMIITGGENVYPTEIEMVINEHPAVMESTVIGIPHAVWGEAIAAVVVCKSEVTSDNIIAFCKGRIGGYKTPKSVHFVLRAAKECKRQDTQGRAAQAIRRVKARSAFGRFHSICVYIVQAWQICQAWTSLFVMTDCTTTGNSTGSPLP